MMRAGLTLLASAALAACALAQSQTSPPANAQTSPAAKESAQTEAGAAAIPAGPAVTVELNESVDSKKAKTGDKVEAHTIEALKNGNDVVIPKGTKLIGHVTEATARAKGDSESSLAVEFDKAMPKKEQEIALNVVILAVAAPTPTSFGGGSPSPGADPLGNTATGTQTSPMGASHPQNPNAGNYPVPNAPDGAAGGAGAGGSALAPNSRGVYGLKDLKLMMDTSKANGATTVITSTGKEVRLDGGTRLLLVTQKTSSAAPGQ